MKPILNEHETCQNCGFNLKAYKEAHDHLKLGTLLNDRYVLGKVLGHGGFGITYITFDTKLNQTMAIKEYLPRVLANRTQNGEVHTTTPKHENKFKHFMDRFLDEAKVLAKFNNEPGIVSVQDYFYENNTVYIVMHYIEGKPLDQYLKEQGGRLSYDQALKYMLQVMQSLKKVHAEGVIHRDISPENIFISHDGTIKLLDFGAAREILEGDQTLSIILKKGYAPLEQYSSKGHQGPWTDVYSVAATFYKLLTGSIPAEPFDRLTEDTLMAPRQLEVEMPYDAEAALLKALSVQLKDRYQNLDDFIDGLYGEALDATVFSDTSIVMEKRKSLKPLIIGLVSLVVLLSVVVFFLSRPTESNNLPEAEDDQVFEEETSPSEDVTEEEVSSSEDVAEEVTYPDFSIDPEQIYGSSYFVEVYSGGEVRNEPICVVDGDVKTGWCEDIKGHGIGEWLLFDGNELKSFHSVSVINGYAKSEKLYYLNDRLKKASLTFSDGSFEIIEFEDGILTMQEVVLKEVHVSTSVKLTILEVYPGSDYADCYINEVRFNTYLE